MAPTDHRRHPREDVALAAVVSPGTHEAVAGVLDLSEGGACLEWVVREGVTVGTPVRLCFLLQADQAIELHGRVVRLSERHAGIEFQAADRALVQQLLNQARGYEFE